VPRSDHRAAAPANEGPPSESDVLRALGDVVDPELGGNVVDLGMVRRVAIDPEGRVQVELALTIASCPLRNQLRTDVERAVSVLPGVRGVEITTGVLDEEAKRALMARARRLAQERAHPTAVPTTARVLAVASGKGGVGKSSISVNLAVALAHRGLLIGLLDADIWGFSVPRMLGVTAELTAKDRKIVPVEIPVGPGSLQVVSMGFLAGEETAVMWRGLVLNRAVQQFLEDVRWGPLSYLVIDMPPGTGDVQMGLARMLPRTEVLVVTTPPVAAEKVATRAADMARRGHLRVAGVVENMAPFVCEHGTRYALFGEGGGARLAAKLGVPLLGSIPLDPSLAAASDEGRPVAAGDGPLAEHFAALADRVVEAAPPLDASGCTARMLERLEEAAAEPGA
jgi:ATP-binding protein involved in chromosome partitioning